jgi:predicted DNA-binding transcriptional regulator AlpA
VPSEYPNVDDVLLVSGAAVCRRCNWGVSFFHSLRRSGRFPLKVIRLGRTVRFSARELELWVQSGCPPASRWSFIQEQAAMRRTG